MNSLGSVVRGVLPFALLLFSTGSTLVGAFQAAHTGGTKREQITVKVRNGQTGLPVWLASPYVYVGKVDTQHMAENQRKTTFWNDAHVDVSGANLRRVSVFVDFVAEPTHSCPRFAVVMPNSEHRGVPNNYESNVLYESMCAGKKHSLRTSITDLVCQAQSKL